MSQKFGILGVPKAQRIPKFWDLWVFLNPQKIPKIENPKSSKNPTNFTFLGRKKSQKFELPEPLEKSQKSLNPFKLRIPNPGCGEGSKIWEFFSGIFWSCCFFPDFCFFPGSSGRGQSLPGIPILCWGILPLLWGEIIWEAKNPQNHKIPNFPQEENPKFLGQKLWISIKI